VVDAAAERVQRAFDEPFLICGELHRLGVSVGRAVWPDDAAEVEALMRHADAEMYRAKRGAGIDSAA
jgi:GGDEF domain-containing protein